MARTIVILLDGTSNGITARRTNILRLYGCLRKTPEQIVYYDPGVGTIGAQGAWSRWAQDASEIWGMATGLGIDANVKEAYRFLVETCARPGPGAGPDRICLFGFSRGAYTARMLAGFLHAVGLMEPRNLNLLDHAFRAYKRISEGGADSFDEINLYGRILATARQPVHLLGLFDTVASVIEPGPGLLPQLRSHAFTSLNASVAHVRHAVALEERRRMFTALPWPAGQVHGADPGAGAEVPQDAKEVWFAGTHGDVGGGVPEAASALAKIPLLWMIEETGPLGLDIDPAVVERLVLGADPDSSHVALDAHAPAQDSMTAAWRLLEKLPLPTKQGGWTRTRGRPRQVPEGALIHASAVARAERRGGLPAHVPADHRVEGDPARWR